MGGGRAHDAPVSRMMRISSNRAVTALFRVFGRDGAVLRGDSVFPARRDGMHRGEWMFLAAVVPLVLVVAVADGLGRWSPLAAVLGTLPAAWLLLNVLPFLLGASRPLAQWLGWAVLSGAWAAWRCQYGGLAGVVAVAWLAVLVAEALAWGALLFRRTMEWQGGAGIAWRSVLFIAAHAGAVGVGVQCGLGWGLLCLALIAACYCGWVLRPVSQALGTVVTRTDEYAVLITIDDGPDPHDTPVLLDLLDRHQAKAVFFVIGEKARAHPELVREIVRRGHEIGNHTLTHPQATFWCAGAVRTRREILGCQQVIEEITGVAPRWFRAPVGHRNLFTHPIAAALGLEVMAWKRRGFDAVCTDAGLVVSRILAGVEPGDIALLHEATPIARDVLEGVLMGLKECGLKLCAPTQSDDC